MNLWTNRDKISIKIYRLNGAFSLINVGEKTPVTGVFLMCVNGTIKIATSYTDIMEYDKKTMAAAVCVEIIDKRDYYVAKALERKGFESFVMGQEWQHKNSKKVYVRSIRTDVTLDVAKQLVPNAILFARDIVDDEVISLLKKKNISYHNILAQPTFIVKNACLTAEGALGYIIMNTEIALKELKVLVLGYGRVGNSLTKILKDNYAYVAVATDDEKEYAFASILADKVYTLNDYTQRLGDFSAIVNTVPKKILQGETIELIDKDCFVLDLASKPGGVDFDKAKDLQLNVMHALGVPGKVAPQTAGLYITDIIIEVLRKEL